MDTIKEYTSYTKIIEVLQKNGLDYGTATKIYNNLQDIYLKETDEKTKDRARVLSSAIFEIKSFYINYIEFMKK